MKEPSNSDAVFIITKNEYEINSTTKISLKDNDKTTLILELSKPFTSLDSITLKYTSGNLQFFDDGVLLSFGPVDVFNCVR